jgi:hypothetical protein
MTRRPFDLSKTDVNLLACISRLLRVPDHRCRVVAVGVVALLLSTARGATAQSQRRCLPPDSLTSVVRTEAVGLVSAANAEEARFAFRLPAGSATYVSIVQNDSVCAAVVGAFETVTRRVFSDSFVVVRIFDAAPFYLIAPLRDVPTSHYLIGPRFEIAGVVGAMDNVPGDDGTDSPPSDLHIVDARDGRVELAWSSSATHVTRYRLQRAVGSGRFQFVEEALPGTARSAVDSGVLAATTYRYRVVAYGSIPTGRMSNEVAVILPLKR